MDKRKKNSIIIIVMMVAGFIGCAYTPIGLIPLLGGIFYLFLLLMKDITGNGDV